MAAWISIGISGRITFTEEDEVAPIPKSVSALAWSNTEESKTFRRTLLAVLLRNFLDSEDGEAQIVLTRNELEAANGYSLKCTTIEEEDAVVLTAVKR